MRKLLFNLHLYGALAVGLFVVLIGVTGSVMAFEEDIDRLSHPKLFHVDGGAPQLRVSALLKAAAAAYPGQRIGNIRLPQTPTDSASFSIRGPRQVLINPYTGAILGERNPRTWLSTIHQLHIRLSMGPTGSTIVMCITAVLLFLIVSGIYLWWPRKRFTIRWNAGAWRANFDIHNAVGIYSALFLFLLGTTGIVIHFDNDIERYLHKIAGTTAIGKSFPSVMRRSGTLALQTDRIGVDDAMETAWKAIPGAKALSVYVPANPKGSFVVSVRYPEDLTPGGRSWVIVDQYSGKILGLQNSRTAAAATRTMILNRAVHTGDILGYPTKALMCVSSLMLIAQAITGYFMWWKKWQVKRQAPNARKAEKTEETVA